MPKLEKNLWELVVDELTDRQRRTRTELQKRFKRTRPFRQVPISKDKVLAKYETLRPEQIDEMRGVYGEEVIEQFRNEMENLKIKKMGGYNG